MNILLETDYGNPIYEDGGGWDLAGGFPTGTAALDAWDMRRMLGDLGHDVESSVFTICDFNHKGREINRKGLLRANAAKEVVARKIAYGAVILCGSISFPDGFSSSRGSDKLRIRAVWRFCSCRSMIRRA